MDLDEWEYLPDDAFLDFQDQCENKVLFSNMCHDYYIVQPPFSSSTSSLVRSSSTTKILEDKKQERGDPQLSQVHFKKASWELPESVDMKMDPPKSPTSKPALSFGLVHQTSTEFDDIKGEEANKNQEEEKKSNNIWKLSFTGIGAICSFGLAAATICILFLGSRRQSSGRQFRQMYSDDSKRIKEVVQRATKFDEAFSAVRRVSICRAHITSGGYYSAL